MGHVVNIAAAEHQAIAERSRSLHLTHLWATRARTRRIKFPISSSLLPSDLIALSLVIRYVASSSAVFFRSMRDVPFARAFPIKRVIP